MPGSFSAGAASGGGAPAGGRSLPAPSSASAGPSRGFAGGISSGRSSHSSLPSSRLRGISVTVPSVEVSIPFRIAPVRFWPAESITSV